MTQIAVVQKAPAFLDKEKTIQLAVDTVVEAAANGAKLVVFTEAFIPGYPAWVWRLRPGGDWGTSEALHHRLLDNSVNVDSDDLDPLYEVAKKHQVTIVGRIGALLCWENFMPLARYAMYAQGVEVYIAPTYDSGDGWLGTLQHIAREGCCYVVGCGNLMRGSDIPGDFPEKDTLYPNADEWVNPGDSVVIAPGGEIVAGPMNKETGILYYDIDREKVKIAKRAFDVVGHYARPDIFQLHVNTQPQSPAVFK